MIAKLSSREYLYISNIDRIRDELCSSEYSTGKGRSVILTISDELAIRVSGILTERLAAVGFDRAYELTKEGELIENLIERFRPT